MNIGQLMSLMNSPMGKMVMSSKDPRSAAINMIKSSPNANTEIGKNILGLLEKGDIKAIEEYGRNLAQSQGIDIGQLMKMFGE